MSVVSESLRSAVTSRAGDRCEYCRLPTRGQVGRFPVDHVIPQSDGGRTALDNLALACPHCNGHKWAHTTGTDPVTRQAVPLFNPRTQLWPDHFRWSAADLAVLEGKSPCGRATIDRLEINHPEVVLVRRLLWELRLFPGAAG